MAREAATYRYLNRGNRWEGFELHGLDLAPDGSLGLSHLPAVEGPLAAGLAGLPAPEGPGGLAVGPDGSLYLADRHRHQILRIDPCDGCVMAEPCAGGAGDAPGRLHQPRGLLYLPDRQVLLVVDSANHRLQLFHWPDFQVVDVWGRWGKRPGEFRTPVAAAVDRAGYVYVVDNGVQAGDSDLLPGDEPLVRPGLQRFGPLGRVDLAFARRVRDELRSRPLALRIPCGVVVAPGLDEEDEVWVLDAESRSVFRFDTQGSWRSTIDLGVAGPEVEALGLAVLGDRVLVGDNRGRRILSFRTDGRFLGAALGFAGPVSVLAGDGRGGLLAHSGAALEEAAVRPVKPSAPCATGPCADELGPGAGLPVRLSMSAGHVESGFLVGGPFESPSQRAEQWHWIRARLHQRAPGARVQLFLYAGPADPELGGWPAPGPAPAMAPWRVAPGARPLRDCVGAAMAGSGGSTDTCRRQWVSVPPDAPETLWLAGPEDALWIGVELSGDGTASPVLEQLRIDFDHPTLIGHLPALFQTEPGPRQLVARMLTLFESGFAELEAGIDRLPSYFDPWATPERGLDWLAGWLALEVSEDWPDEQKRRAIAEAFGHYGWRGTPEGLRRAVKRVTGIDVLVEEPIRQAQWWSLAREGETAPAAVAASRLGLTTMLAAAEPQGAVLGSSAVLDNSHLIRDEDYGAPLFTDVAHRFTVRMYQGRQYSEQARAAVEAVIERERPAHVAYHLCVVAPALRVGLQARVGVDTIVAGPALPSGLGGADSDALTLGGTGPGRIGSTSTLGLDARLAGAVG